MRELVGDFRPISTFMTNSPVSIEAGAPIGEADALMRANGFQFLAVIRDGKPIGVIGNQDLKLMHRFFSADSDSSTVEELSIGGVCVVHPEDEISSVAELMLQKQVSAAVVARDGNVVGTFTAMDAFRALSELLR